MGESAIETKKKILDSAMAEFLEKGFMNASLRTIASNAGLTTGAMYRHFKDKDALFIHTILPSSMNKCLSQNSFASASL